MGNTSSACPTLSSSASPSSQNEHHHHHHHHHHFQHHSSLSQNNYPSPPRGSISALEYITLIIWVSREKAFSRALTLWAVSMSAALRAARSRHALPLRLTRLRRPCIAVRRSVKPNNSFISTFSTDFVYLITSNNFHILHSIHPYSPSQQHLRRPLGPDTSGKAQVLERRCARGRRRHQRSGDA